MSLIAHVFQLAVPLPNKLESPTEDSGPFGFRFQTSKLKGTDAAQPGPSEPGPSGKRPADVPNNGACKGVRRIRRVRGSEDGLTQM